MLDFRVGQVIEASVRYRKWREGVPSSVRKKPNYNPEKTDFWTEGEFDRLVAGKVTHVDNGYILLRLYRNSRGYQVLAGRETNISTHRINHAKIIQHA